GLSPGELPCNGVPRPVSEDQPRMPDTAGEGGGDQLASGDDGPVDVPRATAHDAHLRPFAGPERHRVAPPGAVCLQVEQARRGVVDLEYEELALGLFAVAIDHCWSGNVIRSQQSRLYAEVNQTVLLGPRS